MLPTGYSFNLDGSTLHLAVASVFVAQAAGVQGIVIIEALIGTDGLVKEAKVLRGVQMLDAAMQSQLNIPSKTSGVVVSSVETGSAAESAGLQRGDVIQEVNHEVVKSLDDYHKASAKVKKDEMVVLLLSRQGNNLFVAVNPK